MSTEQPDPTELKQAVRRVHLSVLAVLATCGASILVKGFEGDEPPPDRIMATLGIALGLAAILARRMAASPAISAKTALFYTLSSLVIGAALGLLGAYLAWMLDASETGLLFTLAGLIFSLRPPARLRTS
jgi:hypothetical protein